MRANIKCFYGMQVQLAAQSTIPSLLNPLIKGPAREKKGCWRTK